MGSSGFKDGRTPLVAGQETKSTILGTLQSGCESDVSRFRRSGPERRAEQLDRPRHWLASLSPTEMNLLALVTALFIWTLMWPVQRLAPVMPDRPQVLNRRESESSRNPSGVGEISTKIECASGAAPCCSKCGPSLQPSQDSQLATNRTDRPAPGRLAMEERRAVAPPKGVP
jgi:hypothetical protein